LGRLEKLQKEITKNLCNSKTVDDIIENWSPNNLRRLYISPNTIIVEYYVTEKKKTPRLKEYIDVREDFRVEYENLKAAHSNGLPIQYTPLLSALVNTKVGKSVRIFSSIEEIIFFGGYPVELAGLDRNLDVLVGKSKANSGNTEDMIELLKSRFVRLNNISIFPTITNEEEMKTIIESCKPFGALVSKKAFELGHTPTCLMVNKDWWKGRYLRAKDYRMDETGSRLYNYFVDNINEQNALLEKRERNAMYTKLKGDLDLLDKDRVDKSFNSFYTKLNKLAVDFVELLEYGYAIYEKAGMCDRAEWCNQLADHKLPTMFHRKLNLKKAIAVKFNALNMELLRKTILDAGLDGTPIEKVLTFIENDLNLVSKEPPNLIDFEAYETVFKWLLNTLSQNAYIALVRYGTQTGFKTKYVDFFMKELDLKGLKYTESIIGFCDEFLEHNYARKCFELSHSPQLVNDSEFMITIKARQAMTILKTLKPHLAGQIEGDEELYRGIWRI
jgi:hypothetical protein